MKLAVPQDEKTRIRWTVATAAVGVTCLWFYWFTGRELDLALGLASLSGLEERELAQREREKRQAEASAKLDLSNDDSNTRSGGEASTERSLLGSAVADEVASMMSHAAPNQPLPQWALQASGGRDEIPLAQLIPNLVRVEVLDASSRPIADAWVCAHPIVSGLSDAIAPTTAADVCVQADSTGIALLPELGGALATQRGGDSKPAQGEGNGLTTSWTVWASREGYEPALGVVTSSVLSAAQSGPSAGTSRPPASDLVGVDLAGRERESAAVSGLGSQSSVAATASRHVITPSWTGESISMRAQLASGGFTRAVKVVDELGSPIVGAEVAGGHAFARTDAMGVARLSTRGAQISVHVSAAMHNNARVAVDFGAEEELVRLGRQALLSGTVRNADGTAVADARVVIESDGSSVAVQSDAAGRYQVHVPAPAVTRLIAELPALSLRSDGRSELVGVGDRVEGLDLVLAAAPSLTAHVLIADSNRACEAGVVELSSAASAEGGGSTRRAAIRNGAAQFVGLAPGLYVAQTSCLWPHASVAKGVAVDVVAAEAEQHLDPWMAKRHQVTLELDESITAQVGAELALAPAAALIAAREVKAWASAAACGVPVAGRGGSDSALSPALPVHRSVLDERRRVTFAGLAPGTYRAFLQREDGSMSLIGSTIVVAADTSIAAATTTKPVDTETSSLRRSSESEADVVAVPVHATPGVSLIVRVTSGEATPAWVVGVIVELIDSHGVLYRSAPTDGDGRAVLTQLPPGPVMVRLLGAAGVLQEVRDLAPAPTDGATSGGQEDRASAASQSPLSSCVSARLPDSGSRTLSLIAEDTVALTVHVHGSRNSTAPPVIASPRSHGSSSPIALVPAHDDDVGSITAAASAAMAWVEVVCEDGAPMSASRAPSRVRRPEGLRWLGASSPGRASAVALGQWGALSSFDLSIPSGRTSAGEPTLTGRWMPIDAVTVFRGAGPFRRLQGPELGTPARHCVALAFASGGERAMAPIGEGGVIDLELGPPASLEVSARAPSAPQAGVQVEVQLDGLEGSGPRWSATTDAQGAARMLGLPAGRYLVTVHGSGPPRIDRIVLEPGRPTQFAL